MKQMWQRTWKCEIETEKRRRREVKIVPDQGAPMHPMLPKPVGNGCECTQIEAGGVCKEMGEVLGEIDEHKDKRNSKIGVT